MRTGQCLQQIVLDKTNVRRKREGPRGYGTRETSSRGGEKETGMKRRWVIDVVGLKEWVEADPSEPAEIPTKCISFASHMPISTLGYHV